VREIFSLTGAKARFSEIISRLIHKKDTVVITRKGKEVAVLLPIEKYRRLEERKKHGLLDAAGGLADLDKEVEDMVRAISNARLKEKGRKAPF
jgi:prevent-host-death family protein